MRLPNICDKAMGRVCNGTQHGDLTHMVGPHLTTAISIVESIASNVRGTPM